MARAGETSSFSSSMASSAAFVSSSASAGMSFMESSMSWFTKGRSTMAVAMLKKLWKFAMSPLLTVLAISSVTTPVRSSMPMTIMNIIVPMTLKRMCAMPVRLASLEVPREQRKAVTMQVPMLMPMMSGYTSWKVMAPVTESACSMPTTAELL